MLSNCLKFKNNRENVYPKVPKTKMVDQCYHQNELYAVVKNQDL